MKELLSGNIDESFKEQVYLAIIQKDEIENKIPNIDEIHELADNSLEELDRAINECSTSSFTANKNEIDADVLLENLEDNELVTVETEIDDDEEEGEDVEFDVFKETSNHETLTPPINEPQISSFASRVNAEKHRFELERKEIENNFKSEDYFSNNLSDTYSESEVKLKDEQINKIMDMLAANTARYQFIGNMELEKSKLDKFLSLLPPQTVAACYKYCHEENILDNAPLEHLFISQFNMLLSVNQTQRLAKGYTDYLDKISKSAAEHYAKLMSIQHNETIKAMSQSAKINAHLIKDIQTFRDNAFEDVKQELELYINQANLKYYEDFQTKGNYLVKVLSEAFAKKVESTQKASEASIKKLIANVNEKLDSKYNDLKREQTIKPYVFIVASSLFSSLTTAIIIKFLWN